MNFNIVQIKAKKQLAIADWTDNTLALKSVRKLLPKQATRNPKNVSIKTHNSIEPSWLPQVPLILYSIGLAEWEFSTTSFTEKSDVINAFIKAPKLINVSKN